MWESSHHGHLARVSILKGSVSKQTRDFSSERISSFAMQVFSLPTLGRLLCGCQGLSLHVLSLHVVTLLYLAQLLLQITLISMRVPPPSPAFMLPCSEERIAWSELLPDHCCSISWCDCQPGALCLITVKEEASSDRLGGKSRHPCGVLS